MNDSTENEYRIAGMNTAPGTALMFDRQPKALRVRDTRRAIERQTHGLVVQVTGEGVNGGMFADWFYDLRRQRLRIYGGLLRFLDVASERVPKSVLKLIPGWISSYIDDLYS